MKQIIPPARTVEPAVKETSAAAPVLEPIKPLPPKPAQRQPELVMLGAKPTRYSNIDTLLAKPAYQSRNSKFIVRVPGSRKEVLKDDTTDAQARRGVAGRLVIRLTNRFSIWKTRIPGLRSTGFHPISPCFAR